MSKKVKKFIKKATKGLGKVDPLRGGDVILEGAGLPNLLGEETGALSTGTGFQGLLGGLTGANAASESSEALAKSLAEQQRRAQSANVDLSVDNVADVNTGGTAESQASPDNRRRRRAGGLSGSLGINVR